MGKLLTKSYFDKHPLKEFSAARMQYSLLTNPAFEEIAHELIREHGLGTSNAEECEQSISKEEDLTELLHWTRRSIPGEGRLLLRRKLLAREQEAMPEVQRMLLTTANDFFVENALYLFVGSQEDYSRWLLDHYQQIRYSYARSTMCLALGFRGDASIVPFLMAQVDLMEKRWPNESFSQGPLLALHELKARFNTV